ncbi:hypothetical protein H5410_059492 [Solanum commersonii]|uniref:Zinc finger PMZ-type domain-containing protein n=1 Tax=Solanum commersonii TaxID=4109 RepID=A0A9J5W3M0_SOLCO|nr:hypothetical protein H5410_059492 [Solanum commersonii]
MDDLGFFVNFLVYKGGQRYIVYLERKICNYRRFQHDEISCAHTIIVVKSKSITKIHSYCFDYYRPAALANTYEVSMVSMLDKDDWSAPEFVLEEIILPPRYKKMPR